MGDCLAHYESIVGPNPEHRNTYAIYEKYYTKDMVLPYEILPFPFDESVGYQCGIRIIRPDKITLDNQLIMEGGGTVPVAAGLDLILGSRRDCLANCFYARRDNDIQYYPKQDESDYMVAIMTKNYLVYAAIPTTQFDYPCIYFINEKRFNAMYGDNAEANIEARYWLVDNISSQPGKYKYYPSAHIQVIKLQTITPNSYNHLDVCLKNIFETTGQDMIALIVKKIQMTSQNAPFLDIIRDFSNGSEADIIRKKFENFILNCQTPITPTLRKIYNLVVEKEITRTERSIELFKRFVKPEHVEHYLKGPGAMITLECESGSTYNFINGKSGLIRTFMNSPILQNIRYQYCVHINIPAPDMDNTITQMLRAEHDEEDLLKEANLNYIYLNDEPLFKQDPIMPRLDYNDEPQFQNLPNGEPLPIEEQNAIIERGRQAAGNILERLEQERMMSQPIPVSGNHAY